MGSNLRRAKISKLELGPGVEDKQPDLASGILEFQNPECSLTVEGIN